MPSYPLPNDESARLNYLNSNDILAREDYNELDAIVHLVKEFFNLPVALISFVDEDRLWFKARVGVTATHAPRAHSLCTHAILDTTVTVIPDASTDGRFTENPYVACDPHFKFYAGAPIITPSGVILGTLCIIDSELHPHFSAKDEANLARFATLIASLIELKFVAAA